MRLHHQVAIITGGNSGIGQATAERFASEGARVVIAARDPERAASVVEMIRRQGGDALFILCDVSVPEQCQQVVAQTLEHFGKLDILVNNAGMILRNHTVLETTPKQWELMFDVNSKGVFLMSKYALPHLIQTRGNIVNVSSYAGLVGFKGAAAYCAAKGSVVQLTRAMAVDHAGDGVRVNCVCPGSVHTPMIEAAWATYGEGAQRVWESKHPLGRIAKPEEIASAILYLASAEASFITGVALAVDGGITAG
jgi:NAD(P)-dependent dehydrogenase (short-subunit alcohol dehydrogenase family)